MHKWTRNWSEFISTKKHLYRVGFDTAIILFQKNLDSRWSGDRILVIDWLMIWSEFIWTIFFESKMTGWIFLYELEPNHQPISDRINHGASSYKEKLALHRNQRDINPFLSIRTRTIFEFIYALSFIMLLIWVISYGVYYMIYTLWISSQSLCVVCNVFIIIISGMCLAVSFNHWRCIIFVSMILEHQMQSNTYLGLRAFLIKYVLFNLVCVKGWFKFTISHGPYEISRPISWSISYGPYDSKSFRRFLNDSILKQVNKLTRIKL